MLIMIIACIVPLILYYIYHILIRMRTDRGDKSLLSCYVIAISSFILCIVSECIVLWFFCIREYFADRFAGEITFESNNLASVLVNIGYSLAGKEKKIENRKSQLEAVKALGIFGPSSARTVAAGSIYP